MTQNQPVLGVVMRGLATAMGVAVIVLSILRTADSSALIMMLGIGMLALGLESFGRGR